MASIHDILRPITLTKVVSRVASAEQELLSFFGMNPGGTNESYLGHGREGSYHVFNHVRTVGRGRAPGTAAARIGRQPVHRVPFVYPRMHEQIDLLAEEIHNISKISDPRMRDEAGKDYIRLQTRPVGERLANFRTAMLVGMIRDALYVTESGDDWYFSYTSSGALFRINFQMPAGNQSQLNMLGDGDIIDVPWDNAGANIPLHCQKINAAFLELNGGRLEYVMVDGGMWNNIVNNDYVAAAAGIANPPFKRFERQVGTGPDGTPINAYMGELLAVPGVTWMITDSGIEVGAPGSEAYTPHIGSSNAAFLGSDPSRGNWAMMLGSEPIAEYDNGPETVKIGAQTWSKKSSNPTATEIFSLDNALAVNHVPNSIAYGTVTGF